MDGTLHRANFVRHDPGLPFEVRGPLGVAKLHDALLPAFPDLKTVAGGLGRRDEKVVVRLRVMGTQTGAFGDLPASGRKIDIDVLDLFQIRAGALIEHWALLDYLSMKKQWGLSPEPRAARYVFAPIGLMKAPES